jgi:hypothetical protein
VAAAAVAARDAAERVAPAALLYRLDERLFGLALRQLIEVEARLEAPAGRRRVCTS